MTRQRIACQLDDSVKLIGGTIDGVTLGSTAALSFSPGSATSTAAAATINKMSGQITTESLTTAAAATYSFTLTNSMIAATSGVFVSVGLKSATTGEPAVHSVVPGAGSCTIAIRNDAAANSLNGTITINFFIAP